MGRREASWIYDDRAEISRFFLFKNKLDLIFFFHSLVQWPANVLHKRPDSKLCSRAVSTATMQLCPCSLRAAEAFTMNK